MLEWEPNPGVCPCLTYLERDVRTAMSEKRSESTRDGSRSQHRERVPNEGKNYKYVRNSAEDPAIAPTRTEKHVSSNARNHPRAELKSSDVLQSPAKSKHGSNHVQNHLYEAGSKRKRSSEDEEEESWTEHTSSSGRVYYYNKKLDKSQWEKPKGYVKKMKQDLTTTSNSQQKSKSSIATSVSSTKASAISVSKSSSDSALKSSALSKPSSDSLLMSAPPKSSSASLKHSVHSYHSSNCTKDSGQHTEKEWYQEKERSHAHSDRSHGLPERTHARSHLDKDRGHSEREKARSFHGSRGEKREREGGHHHHHQRHHYRHSSSKGGSRSRSGSVSPKSSRYEKTPTRHFRPSTHSTPNAAKSAQSSQQTSPLAAMNTSMISPSTPASLPANLSQTITATQQIIEQTSLILEHQQRFLSVDNTTPVYPTHPSYSLASTPPSHVRQKLVFNNGQLSNDSTDSTPVTPVHLTGGVVTSPQSGSFMANMDKQLGGLHPLQKALLLQNQFSQQQCFGLPDPNLQMGAPLQAPSMVSALPHHMSAQQSFPTSPQSPIPHPASLHGTPVSYFAPPQPVLQPVTPVQTIPQPIPQPIFPSPMAIGSHGPPGFIHEVPMGGFVPMNSPVPQTPMARLGYHNREESRFTVFPDISELEPLPPSQLNPELFDRSLAECWWTQPHETLQKQMDACSHEHLSRKTAESMVLLGRLTRSQLTLETSRVRSTSRGQRIVSIDRIVEEIDKR